MLNPSLLLYAASVAAAPLTDGVCDEYAALGAERTELGGGQSLWTHVDDDYVWFCFPVAAGDLGTVDLQLRAPALDQEINLHVSAQLGEWPVAQPELAPDNAQSERWWNNRGWIANAERVNGMNLDGERPRYRFRPSEGRELQLSRARFGSGQWQLRWEIRGITDSNGQRGSIHFPPGDGYHLLMVQ